MKKILSFALLLVFVVACSNNDESNSNVTPKQETEMTNDECTNAAIEYKDDVNKQTMDFKEELEKVPVGTDLDSIAEYTKAATEYAQKMTELKTDFIKKYSELMKSCSEDIIQPYLDEVNSLDVNAE